MHWSRKFVERAKKKQSRISLVLVPITRAFATQITIRALNINDVTIY